LGSCLGGRKGGWNEWEETNRKNKESRWEAEGEKREKEEGKILPNCPDLLKVERYGSCSFLLPPCSSNPELKMMNDP